MRGKAAILIYLLFPFGITPAYAGKRYLRYIVESDSEDHPRLCGEKHSINMTITHILGSPPPMRGKVLRQFHLHKPLRITPAYAGKSDS